MDALTLARWQFGITCAYHFLFVALTLGLAPLLAIIETLYVRSGNPIYKRMTQFWGKLFLINFAMGIVTGIVLEFQFGMNWSEYARFVGDIFGAPLAIEALVAFFLEATFLGVWVFGWERVSKKIHLLAIWLVALGVNLSALWILVANSFMQEPVGYTLRNGRAEMIDFFALLLNRHVWVQFPHVIFGGVTTAAFFILGISAWHLLRDSNTDFFRRSAVIAVVYGLIGTVGVSAVGHLQAQHMARVQPMKLAAAEALWETENPASFSLLAISNERDQRDLFTVRIPRLLSLLVHNRLEGEVKGIRDLQAEYEERFGPGNYVPPVSVTYWSFRIMVGAGLVMLALCLVGVILAWKRRLEHTRWFLRLLPAAIALPYIGNNTGWMVTEIGRQPWIVYGLMKTEDAVSPTVTAPAVLFTLILFTVVYGVLLGVDVYLLKKYAQSGPLPEGQSTATNGY